MNITQTKINDYTDIKVENGYGMEITLCSLGASIRNISLPDKKGVKRSVTVRPQEESLFKKHFYGKTVGRTAGRITGAKFTVNGKTANLQKNNAGKDNLHGGETGFHSVVFNYSVSNDDNGAVIEFKYFSPSGEGGYFGNADVKIIYYIAEKENSVRIVYNVDTDEPTLINMTNHAYFNLSGDMRALTTEHTLYIAASKTAEFNENLIVTGISPVCKETDFRTPHKIGDYVNTEVVQNPTNGYDHVYFLDNPGMQTEACRMYSELSGIEMSVRTSAICVVFYSNSTPKTGMIMSGRKADEKYLASCLECEYFSDAINTMPELAQITTPQSPYHQETEYKFTVK